MLGAFRFDRAVRWRHLGTGHHLRFWPGGSPGQIHRQTDASHHTEICGENDVQKPLVRVKHNGDADEKHLRVDFAK